jgi:hypothetical protein
MKNNIKYDDVNIMIYNNDNKLIGYLLIMNRNCKILDSVIIDEKYRGFGFGNIIINYVMSNIIKENGFLLCDKKILVFIKNMDG